MLFFYDLYGCAIIIECKLSHFMKIFFTVFYIYACYVVATNTIALVMPLRGLVLLFNTSKMARSSVNRQDRWFIGNLNSFLI